MKDWLTKLSEVSKPDEAVLQEAIERFTIPELNELMWEFDPSLRPTQMDEMEVKIANAQRMGRELAQDSEKNAGLLGAAIGGIKGFATGGVGGAIGGAAKEGIKDAVVGGVSKAVSGAVRSPGVGGMGSPGGFSYGKTAGVLGGLAQRAAGYAVRNPGTAATVAGAAGGALMAPRDPQTGEKQVLRGAMMGGGLAAGANALSHGAIGNKMRSAVMNRQSPVLGQGARSYMMDAARATKGSYGKAPASPLPTATASYQGGPTTGQVKMASPAGLILRAALEKKANQQTLTYDPSTKTFVRQHVTPSEGGEAVRATGAAPIQAGHTEPVRSTMTHSGQAPFGSREYLQSRMQQAGIAQRSTPIASAQTAGPTAVTGAQRAVRKSPPPIPASAHMAGPAGLAGAAAKPHLPSMAGAVSLVRK